MHSATQILAQRAPPAIRTKTRWQPYHSMPPSNTNTPLTLRSPTVSCHSTNTPTAYVPLSQDCRKSEYSTKESFSQPPPTPLSQTPIKDSSQRDASKHKFAAGLIDQAVNILSEIWRPQDVPDVFKAPSKGSTLGSALGHVVPLSAHQSFPSMTSSTCTPQTSIAAMMAHHHSSFMPSTSQTLLPSAADTESNLLPMKTFVHEVLKRSRTSGSILQAALCYLEAIRPKVPEILQQEKMGIRAHYHPETKILPATEAELAREAELAALEDSFAVVAESIEQPETDELKTVRVTDGDNDNLDSMLHSPQDSASISSLIVEPSAPVDSSSLPCRSQSLPSPLLCPRRAFLASLILASKFFQDKCYSNRAWAKLSGLPPREIGRCERALGQALEWRLWVGKSSIQALSPPTSRGLVRSQTEYLVSSSNSQSTHTSISKSVRKCATLPAGSFTQHEINSLPSCNPPFSISPQSQSICVETPRADIMLVSTSSAPLNVPLAHTATPSPDTPALTYSPTSTDSSGDRTIQMSSFEDSMFPCSTASLPWLDCLAAPTDGAFILGNNCKDTTIFGGSRTMKPTVNIVSVADSELGSYRSHIGNFLWHADSQYISLETTGVH